MRDDVVDEILTDLYEVERVQSKMDARDNALRYLLKSWGVDVLLDGDGEPMVLVLPRGGPVPWRMVAEWALTMEERGALVERHSELELELLCDPVEMLCGPVEPSGEGSSPFPAS